MLPPNCHKAQIAFNKSGCVLLDSTTKRACLQSSAASGGSSAFSQARTRPPQTPSSPSRLSKILFSSASS